MNSFKFPPILVLILQGILAVFAMYYQTKTLEQSAAGVPLSMYVTSLFFYGIQATLSFNEFRFRTTRANFFVFFPYFASFLGYFFMAKNCICSKIQAHCSIWNTNDTFVVGLIALFIFVLLAYSSRIKKGFSKDLFWGYISGITVGVTQTVYAYTIYSEGTAGTSLVAMVIWHFTTLLRIAQLMVSKERTFDNKKEGILTAEIINYATWCLVTIAYVYKR